MYIYMSIYIYVHVCLHTYMYMYISLMGFVALSLVESEHPCISDIG